MASPSRIGRSSLFLGTLVLVLAVLACNAYGRAEPSAGQATRANVIGSVVDASLSPLPGVLITIEGAGQASQKATSDTSGSFSFAAVSSGSYRVRAEHAGFVPLSRDLRVPSGVASVRLPLVLSRPGEDQASANRLGGSGYQGGSTQAVAVPMPPPPPPAARSLPGYGGGGRGGAGSAMDATVVGESPRIQSTSGERSFTVAAEPPNYWPGYVPTPSGESYGHVASNRFQTTADHPLSTFGADVDTASFSNVRRFLMSGHLPPADAVRVEELVNYFKFDYAAPRSGHPIGLTTEVGDCPWDPTHKLVLIGARAVAPVNRHIEGRNLVLLVDVSGSMSTPDKLPLLRTALSVFVDTLNPDDRLAIVTYAGTSGIALPSTPARQRDRILQAIGSLNAGGSTNGGQGIVMAYRTARQAFIPGGVNRVILATDGDFNVGLVNQHELVQLIEREKESGIFLSVLGVGTGNLKDSTMEMLADRGNGHYAYLDTLQEARRVLVREADATLETVAKEVKFQVEFNPSQVAAWKQIGYENRALAAEDFNDDRKDGGEMGAGHTVTVLYEVVPVGARRVNDDGPVERPEVDPLRYQEQSVRPSPRVVSSPRTDEWLTVKVRYQLPDDDVSRLIAQPVRGAVTNARAEHLPFATAVAEFGLLLRDTRATPARWDALVRRVSALGTAPGHAAEREALGELVGLARSLARIQPR